MSLVLDFPSDEDIAISHSHEGKGSRGNVENSKKGEKRKRRDSINVNLSQINDSAQVGQKNGDDKIRRGNERESESENDDQGQHRDKRSRPISEKQSDKQKRRDKRKRQNDADENDQNDQNDQSKTDTDENERGRNKIKKRHRDKDVKENDESGNGNESETDQQRRERKIRHRLKKRLREEGRQHNRKDNDEDNKSDSRRNKRDRREREENSDDDEEKQDDETEREREERHSRRKKKRKLEKLKRLETDRERDQLHWLAEDIDYASQKDQNKHIRLAYDKSKFRYENHFSVDASFLESPEAMAPEKIQQSIEREHEILTRHEQHEREKARIKALKEGARVAASAGSSGSGSGSGSFNFSPNAPVPYIPSHEERTINLVGLASIEDIQFVNPLASEAKTLKECYSKERVKDTEQRTLRDLFEVLTSDPRNRDWYEGDDLVDLANQLLDAFKEVRSPDQFDVHNAIMQTCAPHIYAQDFDERRVEILKKQQRTAFVMSALIMTPRRWGKTMATAMAMAVLLYVCRKITIVTFATGQDISNAFLATTRALYLQLPNARNRILDNSKSTFYCRQTIKIVLPFLTHLNCFLLYFRRMDDDGTRPSSLIMDLKDYNCILARPATVGSKLFFFFVFCIVSVLDWIGSNMD